MKRRWRALLLAGWLPLALAQEPDSKVVEVPVEVPDADKEGTVKLETIEVTASKRLKSQRDIPGTVNAVRGAELEKISAQGMADYLKRVPGVTLPENEADNRVPTIRGLTADTGTGNYTALPAGIYADDMPFTDAAFPLVVPDMNPFDLERVEVLKGPQGTLYGAGALAGLIRYIVEKPKYDLWEGKLMQTFGWTRESEQLGSITAGMLNVPIGHSFAIRGMGLYRHDPGIYDEVHHPSTVSGQLPSLDTVDYNSLQQKSGRLLAGWQLTDWLAVSGMYFRQDTHTADEGSADNRQNFTRDPEPFPTTRYTNFTGANLSLHFKFDWATLLSSSNRITKKGRLFDNTNDQGTGIPEDPNHVQDDPTNPDDTTDVGGEDTNAVRIIPTYFYPYIRGFSQELRLSSPDGGTGMFDWLVGGLYQSYNQFFIQSQGTSPTGSYPDLPNVPGVFPVPTPLGTLYGTHNLDLIYITLDLRAYEYAVFGETTAHLGERWEATTGLRAFKQGLVGTTDLYGVEGNAISGNFENVQKTNYVEQGLTPRFSLRYKHNKNLQAYILASRGYQFGGVQLNPAIIGLQLIAQVGGTGFSNYKSSKLWNYELGLRTEWWNRRLRFDTTLFYLDWKDLQLTDVVHANQTGQAGGVDLTTVITGNVGKAHSEGAELSLELAPFSGATFTSAAAWISALLDTDYAAPDGNVYPPGTRLPGSAAFQWSNVFGYAHRLPLFDSFEGSLELAHTRIGVYSERLDGSGPAGGYSTLDANLGLRRPGSVWVPQITLNAINLSDVRGVSGATDPSLRRKNYYFIKPRTFILSVGWKF